MNLLQQLQGFSAPRPPAMAGFPDDEPEARGPFKPGALPGKVFEAMADGQLWTSARVVARFACPRTSARTALIRLAERGFIEQVGARAAQGTNPENLYRRRT